ncbi:MAG: DUF1549 and DUF1553 domain-containing protein, partial [Gemmataceae bacterium]|nr:DUF1549 and DUF1553 domain-containing protein [Gemmataceae bacterium]
GQYLDRDDMIGTVSYAFLSATVQCARCHDHKFDPISQDEYYQLQAVFAGVDRGNRTYEADPKARENRIRLSAKKAELQSGPKAAEKYVEDQAVVDEMAAWEKSRKDAKHTWKILDPDKFLSQEGATPTKLADASVLYGGARPEKDTYVIEAVTALPQITALCLEVLCDDSLPMKGPGRQDNGNFHLNEIRVEAGPATEPAQRRALALTRATADFNQQGWEIQRAIDGNRDSAWGIFPAVGQPHRAVFVLKEPLKTHGKTRLVFTLEQTHGRQHLIGRLRLSASALPPGAEFSPLPPAVETILAKSPDARSAAETTELTWHYLKSKVEADLAALPPAKLVYAAGNDFLPDGSFKPHKGCRPVHLLRRGDIKRPAKEIGPGALSMVSGPLFELAQPDDESARRLALAKWISSPKNPLTWRSIANRVWHYHFGRGLVSTPSDFGRMGAKPTHPELLDWLAATLLEDGGSLKKLHRRIVTSATYKQSSRHHPEFAKRDADNAYLWRMPRSRLDAETLRDAVLHLSGKLDLTMGGPSVKHFLQSPGIHRTPKVDYQSFDPDGPGAHRRSIYRFVFRTVPDPFLDALDCPDASQFTAMRATSITAQQALSLLNDTFMVRMSEHLAKRLEKADGAPERVRQAYRLVLLREPTARELELFVQYTQRHGLANACRMLLNTNEFLFVE